MTIHIGALEFDGPYEEIGSLADTPGIYAVLCENAGEFELVDLDETENVRQQLETSKRRQEWLDEGLALSFAVHYTADLSGKERREIKECLELEFSDSVAA